jgi:hypothetical protein
LGERIQLNFTDFRVQASADCEQDYVEIRDGYWHKSPLISTTFSPSNSTFKLTKLASFQVKYCGNQSKPLVVVSTTDRMLITYKVSGKLLQRGFHASYEGKLPI